MDGATVGAEDGGGGVEGCFGNAVVFGWKVEWINWLHERMNIEVTAGSHAALFFVP